MENGGEFVERVAKLETNHVHMERLIENLEGRLMGAIAELRTALTDQFSKLENSIGGNGNGTPGVLGRLTVVEGKVSTMEAVQKDRVEYQDRRWQRAAPFISPTVGWILSIMGTAAAVYFLTKGH